MEVKERIAYVRGLIEGTDGPAPGTPARHLWDQVLTVCEALADEVRVLREEHSELEQYVEGIDSDLCEVEEELFGSDEEDPDLVEAGSDDEFEDGDGLVQAKCPRCGEETYFEEAFLHDDDVEISCPECGELLFRGGEHEIAYDSGDGESANGAVTGTRPEEKQPFRTT